MSFHTSEHRQLSHHTEYLNLSRGRSGSGRCCGAASVSVCTQLTPKTPPRPSNQAARDKSLRLIYHHRHDAADSSALPLPPDNSPPSLPTHPPTHHDSRRNVDTHAYPHRHTTHIPLPFNPYHTRSSIITLPTFSRCKYNNNSSSSSSGLLPLRTLQNAHEKIRMVRRRRLLCDLRRRLCHRFCGDQFAWCGVCVLRCRIGESVGSRHDIFAAA